MSNIGQREIIKVRIFVSFSDFNREILYYVCVEYREVSCKKLWVYVSL